MSREAGSVAAQCSIDSAFFLDFLVFYGHSTSSLSSEFIDGSCRYNGS